MMWYSRSFFAVAPGAWNELTPSNFFDQSSASSRTDPSSLASSSSPQHNSTSTGSSSRIDWDALDRHVGSSWARSGNWHLFLPRFRRFLEKSGQFRVVVDGANVGFFGFHESRAFYGSALIFLCAYVCSHAVCVLCCVWLPVPWLPDRFFHRSFCYCPCFQCFAS